MIGGRWGCGGQLRYVVIQDAQCIGGCRCVQLDATTATVAATAVATTAS